MRINKKHIEDLPKIELHLHLDCSISFNVVNVLRPYISKEEYKNNFIGPENRTNLADFLKCTASGIELMQTEHEIRETAKGLFKLLEKDNIVYAEIRFAPLLHLNKGLHPEEVVEIVADCVEKCGNSAGIKAGVILCTLRHFSEDQSLQTVKLVKQFIKNTCVAGFDIAGDEGGYAIENHKKAFEFARIKDVPVTAHAGEAKGAESVWETIKHFKPQRIGHGVRSIEDKNLLDYLLKNRIHLEICPTSNIRTGIYRNIAEHPINTLCNAGVSLSINTDGRSLINVSLTDEYFKLFESFSWGYEQFYACNMNALSHAFISESEKTELKRRLSDQYLNIINNSGSNKNDAMV